MTRILAAATLALALAGTTATAQAAAPANGKYKGKTNQGLAASVTVKRGAISKLLVRVKNSCGATDKPIEVGGPIPVNGKGRFGASLADGRLVFSGRFDGDEVTGKLRERYTDPLLGACDTGRVKFTLTA